MPAEWEDVEEEDAVREEDADEEDGVTVEDVAMEAMR